MNRTPRRQRALRGVTLFETMVIMAISTILLLSLLVAVKSAYEVDRRARDNLSTQLALDQLVRQWRSDGHAALAAEKAGARGIVLRQTNGRQVEYVPGETSLVRNVSQGGRMVAREEISLPPNTACAFELPANPQEKLATLKLLPVGATAEANTQPRVYVVALGAAPLAATTEEETP